MINLFAWQMRRKRAHGRRPRTLSGVQFYGLLGFRRLQLFKRQFELLDLGLEFLRRLAEVHPLQFSDLQFELFNQKIAADKRRFRLCPSGSRSVELCALRSHKIPQGLNVIRNGKIARRHASCLA